MDSEKCDQPLPLLEHYEFTYLFSFSNSENIFLSDQQKC